MSKIQKKKKVFSQKNKKNYFTRKMKENKKNFIKKKRLHDLKKSTKLEKLA